MLLPPLGIIQQNPGACNVTRSYTSQLQLASNWGRRTVNVPGRSPNNRRQGSLAFTAALGFPLAIGPTSSVKQRASNPGFVSWERPCLIRAPLIWLTSLITSTVGGHGGQVESTTVSPRGAFLTVPRS